jgi:hypothetical protein
MLTDDRPPEIHFNYEENETKCRCRLCTGYQDARAAYETVKEQRGPHHRFCKCERCIIVKERFVDYLAALNRLETYSEMSYVLTAAPRPHPLSGECLGWTYGKTQDPSFRTRMWWALSSDQRTIRSWINDFQAEWGTHHGIPASVWAVSGLYL